MSNQEISSLDEKKLDIEHDKLQLEREKLILERDKVDVERDKAKWTTISIVGTALVALLTVGFGIWSQYKQAQSQFEIKAAEIVLKTGSAREARDTAKALLAIFPDRLPKNFAEQFDPDNVPNFGPDVINAKTALLSILPGKTEEQKNEIIELWNKMFPEDKTFRSQK